MPRENLFFLEEWLSYRRQAGCEHCYLHDNTGSEWRDVWGHNVSIDGGNKYGVPVRRLTNHLSDDDVARLTAEIVAKFAGAVTVIEWQPVRSSPPRDTPAAPRW